MIESSFIKSEFKAEVYNSYIDGLSIEEILLKLSLSRSDEEIKEISPDWINKIIDEINLTI